LAAGPPHHERTFAVRWAETGADGRLRPAALLDWMQEAAGEHADLLGVGMAGLGARGLGWVLSSLRLAAERWPAAGERLLLRTWPAAREGLLFHRDFEVGPARGTPILLATTAWVVLDLARRRPARVGDLLPDFPYGTRRALAGPAQAPAAPGPGAGEERFVARRSDLDVNGHVNNAAFVRWALDAAPASLAEGGRLAGLAATYRGEAFAGDGVVVRTPAGTVEGELAQQLVRADDGRELALVLSRWTRA